NVIAASNAAVGSPSIQQDGNSGIYIADATNFYGFTGPATGNQVLGNFIGTNAAGASLGNRGAGLTIKASGNTVGGAAAAARTATAGSGGGAQTPGGAAAGTVGGGNYPGPTPAGTAAVPNTGYGINLNGAGSNTIGGTAPGAGNVISGNNNIGVNVAG